MIIMLIALYLLYRIAYPKQTAGQKDNDISEKRTNKLRSVMGKSRFVLSERSQPVQTPAASLETENREAKQNKFAAETEEKRSAAIPAEQLNEASQNEPNPDELDIPPDGEDEIDYEAEQEAEEMNRVSGREVMLADGVDYDDLQHIAKVVKQQPETVSEETGRTLAALENTDMFEMLVSGDEGKRNWIKSVIDRSLQNRMPVPEDKTSGTDYGDFNIADFTGNTNKRQQK